MTWAHIHLAVNHLPVLLMPVSIAMLSAAWAKKSAELRTAGLAWMVVAAVAGGAAYLTGEPAEHVVEGLPAVSKDAIEEHEETALLAAVATGAAGFLALGVLVIGRGPVPPPSWILATTFVWALVAAGLMVQTANLGGRISHPEIRGPSTMHQRQRPASADTMFLSARHRRDVAPLLVARFNPLSERALEMLVLFFGARP